MKLKDIKERQEILKPVRQKKASELERLMKAVSEADAKGELKPVAPKEKTQTE
ncbi:hypothetical protein [Pokkaliibacter plantistimulans]|uniref:hypothetical protein n=1 Tax=Pokkaliibacter plantistimulans TaxID=1635171 RepID=UPI0026A5FC62|nr:hypothetical protein [Pokkaliibacter plantistimulans]